jgi:hypothetical protein
MLALLVPGVLMGASDADAPPVGDDSDGLLPLLGAGR